MRYLETFKVVDGTPQYLSFHQRRVDITLGANCFDLATLLTNTPQSGTYRARIVYDDVTQDIEYIPYTPKIPQSFALIHDDSIRYARKFADRSALENAEALRGECESVVIVQKGFLTDTPIANIALCQNGIWYTPDTPLLEGTTRMRLIESGRLHVSPIPFNSIQNYEGFALMNALMGFVEIQNGIMALKC